MEINNGLRVSTMTLVSKISSNIELPKLYEHLEITDNIQFIEYSTNPVKGKAYDKNNSRVKKVKESKKAKKVKKFFYNQITLHIFLDKFVNVKVFNNGRIQMTGLKSKIQGIKIINIILKELKGLSETKLTEILDNSNPEIVSNDIVLINSDFDIKFKVNREILQRIVIEGGYYSSYEPLIYPGVNIKYYFNKEKQLTGVCNCTEQCNGKGNDGFCKKITIAVFNSGKIIITGGQSNEHLNTAHKFITDLINDKKEEIMIK